MKKVFFFTISSFLLTFAAQAQSCLPNGIIFISQSEIDDFPLNYPGCTVIEGSVGINYQFGPTDISNLQGLSAVRSIKNGLYIQNNPMLTDLNGLENLDTIGITIIRDNLGLTSLVGLENLDFAQSLFIEDNPNLQSLHGLENLKSISDLALRANPSLTDISALSSATFQPDGWVDINFCGLPNLNGLQGINTLSGLSISGCENLLSLSGLENLTTLTEGLSIQHSSVEHLLPLGNLTTIGQDLNIFFCKNLHDLSGLEKIQTLRYLDINWNDSLENLHGLTNLHQINDLWIIGNRSLSSLSGLDSLMSIQGGVWVEKNDTLPDFNGLNNLKSIGNRFWVNTNKNLTSFSGLEKLQSINGEFNIYDNAILKHLDGLSALSSPLASLKITHNEQLIQLLGLANVPAILGEIWISYNPQLSDCAIFALCDRVLNPGSFNVPAINSNAPGCYSNFDLELLCEKRPVTAELRLDENGDCAIGSGQNFLQNLPVQLIGAIQSNLKTSDANGRVDFSFLEPNGIPALSLPTLPPDKWEVCQQSQIFVASNGKDSTHVYFFVKPLVQCPELTTMLGLPGNFRGCLAQSDVRIFTQNTGGLTATGVKTAVLVPSVFEVLGTIPTAVGQSGDTLFFQLGDLPPLTSAEVVQLQVRTRCDTFLLGQTLCWEAFSTLENPCPDTGAAHALACREVVTSFDPNRKTALPAGTGTEPKIIPPGQAIQYTIEFQNTGTDTAFRVLLRDVLPASLQPMSLRFRGASHPFAHWQIRDGNVLEVLFSPIALPDSNVNEPASHGFFSFEIAQNPALPEGTKIENTAHIVFDFNPPIVTNTVRQAIGNLVVTTTEPQQQEVLWEVLGNPTRMTATFIAKKSIAGEKTFALFGAEGKLLRQEKFDTQSFDFQRNALPSGLYYFTINDLSGRVFSGKIVIAD